MKNKVLSTQPPKGTYDWLPEEFAIRKYIFDTWREICTRFGYEEYLTPILENAEIYRAKSGEDIGGKELMTMRDRADRELAIRPEMTPSVTRMVSRIYNSTPKPLRYFSIANFYREQKPQRGRNKEFWQLNYDIFGADSIQADIEIIQIGLEIMLAFNPPANSFVVYINNRKLIDTVLNEFAAVDTSVRNEVVRTLDKWEKLSREDFFTKLKELSLNDNQITTLAKFMESESAESLVQAFPKLEENQGLKEITQIMTELSKLGYSDWIKFQPNVIRGFDYYDGMVFEVFDTHSDNNRSIFGGGRYGGLAKLFGAESFPAVGCAPGDEPLRLFLESWDLIGQIKERTAMVKYYLPFLSEELSVKAKEVALELRSAGYIVETGLEIESIGRSLKYANQKKFNFVILFGEEEAVSGKLTVKDMETGDQAQVSVEELTEVLCCDKCNDEK